MEDMTEGYTAVLVLLAIVNIGATTMIWRHWGYTRAQKFLQTLLVWVVPILGAWITIKLVREDDEPRSPGKRPFGGGDNDGMPGGFQ